MSIELVLHTQPDVPLEAASLCPDKTQGLTTAEIEKLPLHHGNETVSIADFFSVIGEKSTDLAISGDLSRVKHIGALMSTGSIRIEGDTGAHIAAGMSGGSIIVNGNAGEWVAPEMSGGRIEITGNAGHLVGSAYRGSASGMLGGEIIIRGNARNEVGHAMRNGLIVIGGDSGDFTGVNMLAGTIIVLGEMGIRAGAGMKRGSIVSLNTAPMLPTYSFSCLYAPTYLRLYFLHLRKLGFDIKDEQMLGDYERWCGDAIELNRGEILLYHS